MSYRDFTALVLGTMLVIGFAGCGERHFQQDWHEERLVSGHVVKITSFFLVWGREHDERNEKNDCLALEFVSNAPGADAAAREAEAKEVFGLIRATSETWGFRTATIASFPTLQRKGHYEFYIFRRRDDGTWDTTHEDRKVFSND